jgi:hypothetical protein
LLEPDLWEQMARGSRFLSSSPMGPDDNTFFGEAEKTELRQQIREFRLLVLETFVPSPEQAKIIDDRFDYMTTALDRLNKFDWRSVVINSVISISIALSLNNEQGHVLFNLFQQVFMNVIHLLK